ncbi:ISL3 family transposase [Spirosoma flavum]|uniref:ISL3 family transposase n=1 Tax=Spirosoma flavum TaxID=2048557 RepID=A0ABW6AT72_9BACT
MDLSPLLPPGFLFCGQQFTYDSLIIGLIATNAVGTCPICHTPTSRVHSFYQRTLGDLPISGKRIKLLVRLRKFFCPLADCPRKVFAQSCSSVCKPYARRLLRADQQIQTIGLQTGAKPGARLCHTIGQTVSASTVLRVIRKTPTPVLETPKRLGIDDFAFKKGRNYGTILIDLDQHKPIDLLPDREGKTLEDWLRAHPGIELVTRDRSSVYANAVSAACPNAIQVADRWHLLKNLSETVERFLDTQRASINEVAQIMTQESVNQSIIAPIVLTEASLPLLIDQQKVSTSSASSPSVIPPDKRYAVYQKTKELQRQGHGIRAVTRHLGAARNTIKQYFAQDSFVPRPKPKRSNLYGYEGYLRKRWLEGETSVTVLFEEIKAQGYNGGYTILTTFLADYPRLIQESALPPAQKGFSYSSRRLSRLLGQDESDWPKTDRPFLDCLLNQNASISQVRQLILRFKAMMKAKLADGLAGWCVKAGALSALNGFVRGLRQDYAAVKQAFCSAWSNGQTEGQVNRLKTIKRAMYGKASFELLRLRVLARNWTAPPK